jgi:peptidoglycan biosynthesis protein MviN/MurJ (putative lipid II flippase)
VIADVAAFALNVALIPLLMAVYGLGGIALAAAVAKALKVLALLILFGRRVPSFRLRALGPFAGQMLLASLAATAMLLALQLAQGRFLSPSGAGLVALLAYLAVGGLLGGGVFYIAAYLLRVDEVRSLWRQVRTFIAR